VISGALNWPDLTAERLAEFSASPVVNGYLHILIAPRVRHGSCMVLRTVDSITPVCYCAQATVIYKTTTSGRFVRRTTTAPSTSFAETACLSHLSSSISTNTALLVAIMAAIDKNEISYIDEKSESVHDTKPQQVVQIDNFQVLGLHPDDAEFYINYPEEKRKKVIRKVDVRLVPMLAILYLISHIDRANIGVSDSQSHLNHSLTDPT
jgi:hypothetical protein